MVGKVESSLVPKHGRCLIERNPVLLDIQGRLLGIPVEPQPLVVLREDVLLILVNHEFNVLHFSPHGETAAIGPGPG